MISFKERLRNTEPELIAKSSVLLDCKPWDDETDMKAMENGVRSIEMDGLVWGAGALCCFSLSLSDLHSAFYSEIGTARVWHQEAGDYVCG